MPDIGQYNTLEVKSKTDIGLFLSDGREEVLLPRRYTSADMKVGDRIEVFVYLDNENRPVATTLRPYATVGDFVFLEVKEVNEHGAFLDWGIPKDVFVPYSEQRDEMVAGREYLVYLFIDEHSKRIAATARWNKYLGDGSDLETGEEVELLIYEKTGMGYKAIINNSCEGLLYHNEIFEELEIGDFRKGFVRQVREDGKIDIRLQPEGRQLIDDARKIILDALKDNGGKLAVGDKSSPEEIYRKLKISKKAFKKGIGGLYKDRVITLGDNEIKLVPNNPGKP
jgi:uncharacterized protein